VRLRDRIELINRDKITDSRGWFIKIINGKENYLPDFTGEIYSIMAVPGEVRANHYHSIAKEWFTLIQGRARIVLEDVDSKERISFDLSAEAPSTIFVPSRIAHSFVNAFDEPYILIAYSDKLYDPSDTQSYILI
jgi:dTDP-4-dehydrorhamnose 3,5-epimerase-like enzyme